MQAQRAHRRRLRQRLPLSRDPRGPQAHRNLRGIHLHFSEEASRKIGISFLPGFVFSLGDASAPKIGGFVVMILSKVPLSIVHGWWLMGKKNRNAGTKLPEFRADTPSRGPGDLWQATTRSHDFLLTNRTCHIQLWVFFLLLLLL